MNTDASLVLPSATIPVCHTADVCVIGGSCTGVFAAVRAAEAGLSVALIENHGFLGGTATAGLVPVWHSIFSTDGKRQIISGLTEEIIQRLAACGEARLCPRTDPAHYAFLNVAALELALDELVAEHPSIRLFLHARLVDAAVPSPGRPTHAVIEDKSGRRAIAARFFIDASGDADFLARAGFPTWTLPRSDIQSHTTCALLDGVDRIKAVYPDFSFGELMHPRRGAGLRHVFQWSAPVIGCPSLTFLAATRVNNCDPSDADDLTAAELEARAQLRRIVDAANREFPLPNGDRLSIAAIAPDMGLRESRHARCLYRITGEDVLTGRTFPDTIARGSYRVDVHEREGIVFRYLDGTESRMVADLAAGDIHWEKGRWRPEQAVDPTFYEIPYRSLVPEGSVNVLCAGRMLDCEREAYGALRVMVNCNQMGEAAGLAAARALLEGLSAADACPAMPLP